MLGAGGECVACAAVQACSVFRHAPAPSCCCPLGGMGFALLGRHVSTRPPSALPLPPPCPPGAGVFGVETFLLPDGSVLLNEVAPRPHNSGHYTIEACPSSQFEVRGWWAGGGWAEQRPDDASCTRVDSTWQYPCAPQQLAC